MTRCGPNGAYSVFSRASQCIAQIISEWDKEGLIPPGSKIEVYGVSDPDLSRLLGKSQRKPFREPLFKYGAAPQDYKMLRQGKGIEVGQLPHISNLKSIQDNDIKLLLELGFWTIFLSNTDDIGGWWGPLTTVRDATASGFLLPVPLPGGPRSSASLNQGVDTAVRDAFGEVRRFWAESVPAPPVPAPLSPPVVSAVATATLRWLDAGARSFDTQTVRGLVVEIADVVWVVAEPGPQPVVRLDVVAADAGAIQSVGLVGENGQASSSIAQARGRYALRVALREPLIGADVACVVRATAVGKTTVSGEMGIEVTCRGRPLPALVFQRDTVRFDNGTASMPISSADLLGAVELSVGAAGGPPATKRVAVERGQKEIVLTWPVEAVLPTRLAVQVKQGKATLCLADRQPADPLLLSVEAAVAAPTPVQPPAKPEKSPAGSGAAPPPPTVHVRAKFSVSPGVGQIVVGTEVTFANQSDNADSYEWDFGGGAPKVIEPGTSTSIRHRFEKAGTYSVVLLARAGTQEDRFGIDLPVGSGTAAVAADFALPAGGAVVAGERVRFTNTSTNAKRFEWDFGPGSTPSTDRDADYVFQQAGQYTVRLTAYDAANTPAVRNQVVVVTERGSVLGWVWLVLLVVLVGAAAAAFVRLRPRREVKATLLKGTTEVKTEVVRSLVNLSELGFPDDIRMTLRYDKSTDDLQVEFLAKGRAWDLKRRVPARNYNLPEDSPSAPIPMGQYDIEGTDYRLVLERVVENA
jgi:plastocyanin